MFVFVWKCDLRMLSDSQNTVRNYLKKIKVLPAMSLEPGHASLWSLEFTNYRACWRIICTLCTSLTHRAIILLSFLYQYLWDSKPQWGLWDVWFDYLDVISYSQICWTSSQVWKQLCTVCKGRSTTFEFDQQCQCFSYSGNWNWNDGHRCRAAYCCSHCHIKTAKAAKGSQALEVSLTYLYDLKILLCCLILLLLLYYCYEFHYWPFWFSAFHLFSCTNSVIHNAAMLNHCCTKLQIYWWKINHQVDLGDYSVVYSQYCQACTLRIVIFGSMKSWHKMYFESQLERLLFIWRFCNGACKVETNLASLLMQFDHRSWNCSVWE